MNLHDATSQKINGKRPTTDSLRAAKVKKGLARELVDPKIRRQMILRMLAGFGSSTSELLIKHGGSKDDITKLANEGYVQSQRVRFQIDPRSSKSATITVWELTRRGRSLSKQSGAALWRPMQGQFQKVTHDLLVQALSIEIARILGPVPGRLRTILGSAAISNRPESAQDKHFGGVLNQHVPDAVLSTRRGPVFIEYERTPKTKALERYHFIRKVADLCHVGRVIVSMPGRVRAESFYKQLHSFYQTRMISPCFWQNETTGVWFEHKSVYIEEGVNDWPDVEPVYLDLDSPDDKAWADFRRADRGLWILAFRSLTDRIPFLSYSEWKKQEAAAFCSSSDMDDSDGWALVRVGDNEWGYIRLE